jgi:hypothetical protein
VSETRAFRSIAALSLLALVAGAGQLRAQAESPAMAGPDVTIMTLGSVSNWGASGGIRAYSVGTTSCNIGGAPIAWCDTNDCTGLSNNDHPVIAQGLYRIKDHRFEQIGMSWLKHGWLATNTPSGSCGSCVTPPGGGDQLGVGCTDTYSSGLNGGTGNPGTCDGASGEGCRLGQRSAVNATTGDFVMPYHDVSHPSNISQRIQVAESDLDAVGNPGAVYYLEGQYIAADDGAANNAANNASYRRVTVGSAPNYNLTLADSTVREKSALSAWAATDVTVELLAITVPGSNPVEHYEVARRISAVDIDTWHYEYAIRNNNSDRAIQAFTIQFPTNTPISGAGFHSVNYHSGEPYSTSAWTPTVSPVAGTISWATSPFGTDPNANALRFASTFSFWFDADAELPNSHSVALFKPGSPASVAFWTDGELFSDGFESEDLLAWSASVP